MTAIRGMKSPQPARQLILGVRRKDSVFDLVSNYKLTGQQ
jgi:hypothetical protein